jgi:hypothetical protein
MTDIEFCNTLTEDLSPELRKWLRRATLFLGRIGITRVVEDISQHYGDAYRKANEAGHSGEDAALVAMKSLGSPHKARRRFKRAHLTLLEEDSLRSSYRRAKKGRFMSWFFALFSVFMLAKIWIRNADEGRGLLAFGLLGFAFFSTHYLYFTSIQSSD